MNNDIPYLITGSMYDERVCAKTSIEIKLNDNFKTNIKRQPDNYFAVSNKIDLLACNKGPISIYSQETKSIDTGIAVDYDSDMFNCFAVCSNELTIKYNLVFDDGVINICPRVNIFLLLKNNGRYACIYPETILGELILVPKTTFSKRIIQ